MTRPLCLCALLAVFAALHPLTAAPELSEVLSRMDEASAKFQGMKADIQRVDYNALVDQKDVETGIIRVRREKDKSITLLMELKNPYPLIVAVKGSKAEIYRPRINQVEEYDLSKSKEVLEQAFALGFGTEGSFLREHYNVQLLGEEAVEGQPAVRLELIPKSEEMLKRTPKIEMWISTENWLAVQQKLYEVNSGDYRINTYTNIVLNPGLSDADLRLKLPRGVKRIYPQR